MLAVPEQRPRRNNKQHDVQIYDWPPLDKPRSWKTQEDHFGEIEAF